MNEAFDSLRDQRVVLIGGKGGVGKTTVSIAAALHLATSRHVVLFTTDPASNLGDILNSPESHDLTIEALDAETLYRRFLDANLPAFLELGDRGTYLDKEELRRFFELSLPGADELMAWMRIGQLAEENPQSIVVVDTAPTGHTLRMLGAAEHFRELAAALEAMQAKHRDMVRQFTRRNVRDAMDAFLEDFEGKARRRREVLAAHGCFVPVVLSEPWVVEQTLRLIAAIEVPVPFVVLNRAVADPDCARDRALAGRDAEARKRFAVRVVDAPRACVPLDSVERIRAWAAGELVGVGAAPHPALRATLSPLRGARDPLGGDAAAPAPPDATGPKSGAASPAPLDATDQEASAASPPEAAGAIAAIPQRRLLFFAGKGGVGKTTTSASVALQLARTKRVTILSVDPAHSLRDVFAHEPPPANLTVEIIDTRAKWRAFRDTLGQEIERAVGGLTPSGISVAYDSEAMQKLIEVAPPGADELFAITRLADLIADPSREAIVVDTAPTGHFLRLVDLPATAGEWVREFMRILLHYRELIPAGSLGEELIRASRALHAVEAALKSDDAAVVVVTRPERVVIAETKRLADEVERRGMHVGAVIANAMTPENDCACDRSLRSYELGALAALGRAAVLIVRRDAPPVALADIERLVPLA